MPTIDDILIDKATYKPGEAAHVLISILSDDPETVRGKVALRLVHIDEIVHQTEQELEIEPETALAVAFTLMPPAAAGRGYGLEVTLYSESGAVISEYTSALD